MKRAIETHPNGMRQALAPCTLPCPIERSMRIIGGKWTASILWHLREGPVRFNDLSRMIAGASKKMISDRLQHLEAQGLVSRTPDISTRVITVTYALTEAGHGAMGVLDALAIWADQLEPEEVTAAR